MFQSKHKLDFMAKEWETDPSCTAFYVGTCHGIYKAYKECYMLIGIFNEEKGNGHLDDVFEWFEQSCKRDNKDLIVADIWTEQFKNHLINKRGFSEINPKYVVKIFNKDSKYSKYQKLLLNEPVKTK